MTEVIYMFKQVIVINSNKRTGKKFNLDNIKFIYYKGLCVSITFYKKKNGLITVVYLNQGQILELRFQVL